MLSSAAVAHKGQPASSLADADVKHATQTYCAYICNMFGCSLLGEMFLLGHKTSLYAKIPHCYRITEKPANK